MLESSNYDKYQREELYQLYESKNINGRNELIEKVSLGVSYEKIVDPTNKNSGVTILL